MKNLGETLKQARATKGVELRDASDATKIRIDFLSKMEEGDFDFDLPEIYKRGFLRLYAAYLGLDPKAVMASYYAATGGRRTDKESLRAQNAKKQFLGELDEESASNSPETRYDDEPDADIDSESGAADDKSKYLKIGAIVFCVIAAIVIIVAGVSKFSGSSESRTVAQGLDIPECVITIKALADTSYKLTPESNPNFIYHKGEVPAGDVKTFKVQEALIIQPLPGKIGDLRIERDGVHLDYARLITTPAPKYKISMPRQ
ncbi:MAG: helix-turn-helix domain-containing protein [Opitutales bacterium]|nr:helix-turn-helix domain-containing protein [Opitutales bacterium]